jgi:hypothetical protein
VGCPRAWLGPAVASPPGVGAPLLDSHASAARAGQAARTRGARGRRSEASGGSVRLAAARGGVSTFARSGAYLVPYSGRSRAPPVGGSAPLVVHFRSAQQGCTQNRPLGRRRRRTAKTSGTREVQLQVARAAKCSIKRSGLSARSSCTFSDPPSRTLSVERGSNHS